MLPEDKIWLQHILDEAYEAMNFVEGYTPLKRQQNCSRGYLCR